jgi:hypothetical protein
VFFDKRAGIAEFDGGLPRPRAEFQAFACCVTEWLNHNHVGSPPGRCLGCGETDRPHDPLLPYGVEPTGHAWLHSRRRVTTTSAVLASSASRPARPLS